MCVHESTKSEKFQKLASKLEASYGLVALTLVHSGYRIREREFTMFVNPLDDACIARAAHDLRTWHPQNANNSRETYESRFSEQSGNRIQRARRYAQYSGAVFPIDIEYIDSCALDILPMIEGRAVPDSLDFDDRDDNSYVEQVYKRCLENGYVTAGVPLPVRMLALANYSGDLNDVNAIVIPYATPMGVEVVSNGDDEAAGEVSVHDYSAGVNNGDEGEYNKYGDEEQRTVGDTNGSEPGDEEEIDVSALADRPDEEEEIDVSALADRPDEEEAKYDDKAQDPAIGN